MDGDGRTSGCWLDWAHWWTETNTKQTKPCFISSSSMYLIAFLLLQLLFADLVTFDSFWLSSLSNFFSKMSHSKLKVQQTPLSEHSHYKGKEKQRKREKTHCSSPPQTLCHWGCDAAVFSCQKDSGSSNSQTPPLLQRCCSFSCLLHRVVRVCSQLCVSVLGFPTRAVQAASQLSGHHLHDESYPEPEHVPKQSRLGAHVHG